MNEQQRNLAEREYARKKLPQWTDIDGIIYPRHISLEQCSSEQTAKYKAKLLSSKTTNLDTFVDLTGGFGVDCYYIGKNFKSSFYIEQNPDLCEIVKYNYKLLGFNQCTAVCQDASDYLAQMPQTKKQSFSVIYIDPARRDDNGKRTYDICDCTPDVTKINELLLQKADKVMIKLSPMFDWHKAVKDLHGVTEVHIVSVRNECKELLIILEKEPKPLKLFCINDDSTFIVENENDNDNENDNQPTPTDDKPRAEGSLLHYAEVRRKKTDRSTPPKGKGYLEVSPLGGRALSMPACDEERFISPEESPKGLEEALQTTSSGTYLYEPNASIMKSGCFKELASQFEIMEISASSHLFLSNRQIEDFPGRSFQILSISSMNKKSLKENVSILKNANITTRNFPINASQLRKKLKLAEGGDTYIFATTTQQKEHLLFICRKI